MAAKIRAILVSREALNKSNTGEMLTVQIKVRKIKETLSRRDLCTARIQLIIYTPASNSGTKE